MDMSPTNHQGVDKTKRYGWVTKDEPGELLQLHKNVLQIHPAYQRDVVTLKVESITREWSWIALGALVVAERGGEFWVVDGQHRMLAAKRRSDITVLPCVVFKTSSIKTEAQAFLDLNTGRKPVTAVGKQRARAAAGDPVATFVSEQIALLGLEIRPHARSVGQIKCIGWCWKRAGDNRDAFVQVIQMGAELCAAAHLPIAERLLEGLWFLNAKCGEGLADKRQAKRIRDIGAQALIDGASRASAFYTQGGGKIWAEGMLAEINKGLRQKFVMAAQES